MDAEVRSTSSVDRSRDICGPPFPAVALSALSPLVTGGQLRLAAVRAGRDHSNPSCSMVARQRELSRHPQGHVVSGPMSRPQSGHSQSCVVEPSSHSFTRPLSSGCGAPSPDRSLGIGHTPKNRKQVNRAVVVVTDRVIVCRSRRIESALPAVGTVPIHYLIGLECWSVYVLWAVVVNNSSVVFHKGSPP